MNTALSLVRFCMCTFLLCSSQVGDKNVNTALSLVGFESDIEKAMQFVFGGSFVCSNMDAAKKVTYDDKVMKRSVTLDGEMFDPAGTLTGGRFC